ncbi:hypothetical protein Tco_0046634 [Tanacetum coccineum]
MYPSHLVLIDPLKNIALKRQQYVGEFIDGGKVGDSGAEGNGGVVGWLGCEVYCVRLGHGGYDSGRCGDYGGCLECSV